MGVLALSGCLVTSEIDFPTEELVPPAVADTRGSNFPIASVIRWNRLGTQSLTFEVRVIDPNLNERLSARWLLTGRTQAGRMIEELLSPCNEETEEDVLELPITGTSERPHTFTIDPPQVSEAGCYRLQLAVSGNFSNTCSEVVQLPRAFAFTSPMDDVGRARWTLEITDGATFNQDCFDVDVEEDDVAAAQ